MSANAQSHRVTPGSGYSQYSHWGNRSAALTNNELYVGQWLIQLNQSQQHSTWQRDHCSVVWTTRPVSHNNLYCVGGDVKHCSLTLEQREFISDSDSDVDSTTQLSLHVAMPTRLKWLNICKQMIGLIFKLTFTFSLQTFTIFFRINAFINVYYNFIEVYHIYATSSATESTAHCAVIFAIA